MEIRHAEWTDLSRDELHDILRLRCEVFVVEQRCAYADIDGRDSQARHLFIVGDRDEPIRAYARLFAPGVVRSAASIGRLVVAVGSRDQGLAHAVMKEAVRLSSELFGGPIEIAAQAHLERFYGALGFARTSENYLEDDIPHLTMRWQAT